MKHIIYLSLILVFLNSCGNSKKKYEFQNIWVFEYTRPAEALSLVATPPTLIGKNILFSPDKQLTVLEQNNGSVVWNYVFENDAYIYTNEFQYEGDWLYTKENTNEKTYRFDLRTGELAWSEKAPEDLHQWSNDSFDENWLYISSRYQKIFRYSKNGKLNKTYDLVPSFGVISSARSIRIFANQLIFSQAWQEQNDNGYFFNGRILSIHKETEEVLWEYRTDNGGFIFEPILLEDEIIYAGVTDGPGEFVALNATNGKVIWKTLGIIGQSYTLTDSMVLVNGGVSLYALDKFTGKELWNTGLKFGGGHGQDNIAYLDGYVYHAHSGRLYVLDARNGEIVHSEERSPDGSPFGLLTAGNGKVFVQTDVALYAYTAWE